MTEKDLWKKVRQAWDGHAMRVEASLGGVDPGTPDAHVSCCGRGGWIELKVWPEPLNANQIAWHADACDHGAYARVLCAVGRGRVWLGRWEAYVSRTESKLRPPGEHLHEALERVRSELIAAAPAAPATRPPR